MVVGWFIFIFFCGVGYPKIPLCSIDVLQFQGGYRIWCYFTPQAISSSVLVILTICGLPHFGFTIPERLLTECAFWCRISISKKGAYNPRITRLIYWNLSRLRNFAKIPSNPILEIRVYWHQWAFDLLKYTSQKFQYIAESCFAQIRFKISNLIQFCSMVLVQHEKHTP